MRLESFSAPLRALARMARLRGKLGRLKREGSQAELVATLKKLAEIERWLPGLRGSARKHYDEAVAICRELGDPLELAHAVRHLGDIHHDARRPELAEACYNEALALYRQYGHAQPLNFANAVRRVAALKEEAGDHVQAAHYWLEAYDLYVTAGEPMGVAESAAWLALLARRQEDIPRSRQWLGRASAAAEASGDQDSLKWVRKARAEIEN